MLVTGIMAVAVPLMALAQEDARDTVREMGGGAGSISPGADITGSHRDTEKVERVEQRVPSLLESAQASTGTKLSKRERKDLLRKRAALLQDRKNSGDAASKRVEHAPQATPAERVVVTGSEIIAQDARKKAERDWDKRNGPKLREIDRKLKAISENESIEPLRVPSVLNPR